MVVTTLWIQSWTVVAISVSVLIVLVVMLLCCLCWIDKNPLYYFNYINKNKNATYYLSNESYSDGTVIKEQGLFRLLPSSSCKKSASFNLFNKFRSKSLLDAEQCNSRETCKGFNNLVLQLDLDKEDDVKSCISNDSKQSFYSTIQVARSLSATNTLQSALSHTDLDQI